MYKDLRDEHLALQEKYSDLLQKHFVFRFTIIKREAFEGGRRMNNIRVEDILDEGLKLSTDKVRILFLFYLLFIISILILVNIFFCSGEPLFAQS